MKDKFSFNLKNNAKSGLYALLFFAGITALSGAIIMTDLAQELDVTEIDVFGQTPDHGKLDKTFIYTGVM